MDKFTRVASDLAPAVNAEARTADFIMSTEEPGRDGHILLTSGLQLDNFLRNPVCLWQHMDTEPPIGKWINVRVAGKQLLGTIQYAATALADTIFELVAGKFLRAVSMSWMPLPGGYEPRSGTSGGLLFTKVDVLECSQVSVPALPSALLTAGARGINLRPLRTWSERALDTGRYGILSRSAVAAIYRSTGGTMKKHRGATPTLKALGYYGGNGADAGEHIDRAIEHHQKLIEHHQSAGEHLDSLDETVQRTTGALAELGIGNERVMRCVEDMKRCARALHDVHGDAADVHEHLGDALEAAQSCLAEDENAGDGTDGSGIAPYQSFDQHDTDAARAARVRRVRELAQRSPDLAGDTDAARAARVARVRQLAASPGVSTSSALTAEERQLHARYEELRRLGYSAEQIAHDAGISADALRGLIARGIQERA